MQVSDQIQMVRELVSSYFYENAEYAIQDKTEVNWNSDHIINIGTSIMCTKWGIGYEGGSFVQAVVDNNLSQAVSRADSTNLKALKFYCMMMYNMSMPAELAATMA